MDSWILDKYLFCLVLEWLLNITKIDHDPNCNGNDEGNDGQNARQEL